MDNILTIGLDEVIETRMATWNSSQPAFSSSVIPSTVQPFRLFIDLVVFQEISFTGSGLNKQIMTTTLFFSYCGFAVLLSALLHSLVVSALYLFFVIDHTKHVSYLEIGIILYKSSGFITTVLISIYFACIFVCLFFGGWGVVCIFCTF